MDVDKEVRLQIIPDVITLDQDDNFDENGNEVRTIHSDIVPMFKLCFRR
jgi:hypothetical protein